jgi:hypothetical protein
MGYTAKYISKTGPKVTFEIYLDGVLQETTTVFGVKLDNVAKTASYQLSSGTIIIEGYPFDNQTTDTTTTTTTTSSNSVTQNTKIVPANTNGKITLKKKSGPGDLVGVTELDIVDGKVKFTGLQFNQEGDYVISVICSSPDVEQSEFKVKVLPEPQIVEQNKPKQEDDKKIDGPRPCIAQIDKPSIDLPPMKIDGTGNPNDTNNVADSIGMVPFVNYNNSPIQDRDIMSFKLYHNGIVPKMTISFIDTMNLIKKDGFPKDDTKIEVFLNSRSNFLKSIHLKFKIESFKDGGGGIYTIVGTLDTSLLYRTDYKSIKGTSFEVLRNLCKQIGLGFNSNIQNTDDSMLWRQSGRHTYEFMQDIVAHSYISDNSFMIAYIDYYYCFNYVDVEKEYNRDNSTDVGVEVGNIDKSSKETKLSIMELINESSMNKSCFYYEGDKKVKNNSTKISLKKGYKTIEKAYDRLQKKFLVFNVDSITSNEETSIIMKGSKMDKEAFENNYTTSFSGMIDMDNVHKNYNYSVTQNQINLTEIQKLEMTVTLPNTNFNLYKFQKIKVKVVNKVTTPSDPDKVDWRLTGDWIISDISFILMEGKFYQEVKLVRKELSKTPEEIRENDKKETKPNEENNKTNENPTDNKPNLVYTVGEIYRVKDKDGKEYLLTIKSLSEDGKDVKGNLKEL